MKRKHLTLFILSLIFTGPCFQRSNAQDIDYKGFPEWSWHKEGNTEYYLYTPKGMVPGKKYPVALFLHGCCGVDDHATLRNCVDPPVRMWHNFGENIQRIPTYIISPATSRGWSQHIPDLKKVMDSLVEKQNGDARRIYICGFSMGGEGTFTFINQYPDYFAAAMTIGMKFHGDSVKVKNLPMWLNQGETDWFSRALRKQVKSIRVLNGSVSDTGSTWETGVNPRYTNFKGFGHGVQWEATTRQDMLTWAYAQINDGNKYPNVFFNSPAYGATVIQGKSIKLDIEANDPDGSIAKVNVFVNHILVKSISEKPYIIEIKPIRGRNFIEAIAVDNKGKARSATLVVKTIVPLKIITQLLPAATAGKYYKTKLFAEGYGEIRFTALPGNLPEGLQLYPDGTLKGAPLMKGPNTIKFRASDSTGTVAGALNLLVKQKPQGDVLISNAVNANGLKYRVSKIVKGETPNFNSKDTVLSTFTEEINFSDPGKYAGVAYIKTDINDTARVTPAFLSFDVDENVTLLVAYECLDLHHHSTIPGWLGKFEKQKGQIVAQYRYFNVYAKKYPKGKIVLPGADARHNGVGTNYFVMVKKQE